MNRNSIRFRLTLLYGSVLLISTAILFASFYWVTERELYSHTDTILTSHGERVLVLLSREAAGNANMSTLSLFDESQEIPGMLIFVTDGNGTVRFASQKNGDPLLVQALYTEYTHAKTSTIINYPVGAIRMRFVLLPVLREGNLIHLVIVGHPIDVIEGSLRSLYGSLLLVFLAIIVPSFFGGYILSGSALSPVKDMADEMEKISSENLKKRVQNPGTGDEIESLSHAFNGLLQRLEQSFERERQFIGDVAHELKTPMATIRSSIDVATSRPRKNEEYRAILNDLVHDVDRASLTLTNILDLAWSQTDASQNRLDRVSVTEIVYELLEIGRKLAMAKEITVSGNIPEDMWVMGKREKIFRSLLNILDNAIKYTGKEGKISLMVKKHQKSAHITISDTGKGIPVGDLPHIFDRFYRGKKTEKTGGAGLGLAISWGILTSLGGTVEVKSKVGKGTEVEVTLPLAS